MSVFFLFHFVQVASCLASFVYVVFVSSSGLLQVEVFHPILLRFSFFFFFVQSGSCLPSVLNCVHSVYSLLCFFSS